MSIAPSVPLRLVNPVKNYAWGSTRAIAGLQGRDAPTSTPEAELWLGAHPAASSLVETGTQRLALDAAIAADPIGWLGRHAAASFGPRLPFLMKVLAAEEPLSLQAHPDADRARSGFAAEEARGIPLDAAHRNYRDRWPKPELLRALTPFVALCGLRDPLSTRELFAALGVRRLGWVVDELAGGGAAGVLRGLLTLPEEERRPTLRTLADACRRLAAGDGPWAREAAVGRDLAERYPSDPGVAVALLLELVELHPGEAMHLPPGTPHAYLKGMAVEVMASSDNVLRGGLTTKHVDVAELLEVIGVERGPADRVKLLTCGDERVHQVEDPHFRLSEIVLRPGRSARLDERGVQVLLATGEVTVTAGGASLPLRSGEGAVVPAAAGSVALAGEGIVFRATAGDPPAPPGQAVSG